MKKYHNKFKKNNKIYVILIILIIIFLCLSYFLKDRKISYIESFIQDTYLTIQNIFVIKNNNQLNCHLESEVLSLKEEVINLKKELNVTNINYKLISANVINRNVGYFYEKLTIDKGKKDGIKKNSSVTSNGGLVGIVSEVRENTSTVKLISSSTFKKISIKINTNDIFVYGLLTGYKNNKIIIEGISENVEIKKDSMVMTTGLNENIKGGIYIGKVIDIKTDQFDLTKTVYVSSDYLVGSMNLVSVVVEE